MIRTAADGDIPRLWELDRICFEPGIAYSRAELRRFFGLPGARSLVAESDGEIEGFALGYVDPTDVAHVVTLYVHPSARRRGLGKRLLEGLLEALAEVGAKHAVLEVDVRNSGAIAFYRRLGFRKTSRIPSYYGSGLDAFEMVRPEAPRRSRRAPGGGATASRTRRPRWPD